MPDVILSPSKVVIRPSYNYAVSGNYKVAGTVTVEGTAASRKVRLYDRRSGQLVAATVSAADGTYEFSAIRRGTYAVMALDLIVGEYNAVVADRIDAVPMS